MALPQRPPQSISSQLLLKCSKGKTSSKLPMISQCPLLALQKLYFAEYDLMFFKNRPQMLRHLRKTRLQHPPGDEIYRNGNVSMFEIDGRKEKMYCQVQPKRKLRMKMLSIGRTGSFSMFEIDDRNSALSCCGTLCQPHQTPACLASCC